MLFLTERRQAQDTGPHAVNNLVVQADLDVIQNCHIIKQADVLERAGNASMDDLMRFFAVHPLAAEVERTLGGFVDAGNEVENRRLARAVGADEPDQLGLANFHVEVIHSLQAAELDAEMLCFQYRCCHNGFTLLSRLLPWDAECRPTGGSG